MSSQAIWTWLSQRKSFTVLASHPGCILSMLCLGSEARTLALFFSGCILIVFEIVNLHSRTCILVPCCWHLKAYTYVCHAYVRCASAHLLGYSPPKFHHMDDQVHMHQFDISHTHWLNLSCSSPRLRSLRYAAVYNCHLGWQAEFHANCNMLLLASARRHVSDV